MSKKISLAVIVFAIGILIAQEISYALIPGVGAAVRRVRKNTQDNQKAEEAKKELVNAGNTVCPVMGTKVEPGKALTVEYGGKLYNVCCPVCVKEFKKSPEKYVAIVEKQMEDKGQE